jgi:hypothetical protein
MVQLFSIPVLLVLLSIQITISSKFQLLDGFADIILVWLTAWVIQSRVKNSWIWVALAIIMVAIVSAVPWYAILSGYSIIFILGYLMKKRLWQSPLLSFFVVLILGSVINYLIYYLVLMFTGTNISWIDAVQRVIIPSTIINLIIAFPIYLIARDFSSAIFTEVEND